MVWAYPGYQPQEKGGHRPQPFCLEIERKGHTPQNWMENTDEKPNFQHNEKDLLSMFEGKILYYVWAWGGLPQFQKWIFFNLQTQVKASFGQHVVFTFRLCSKAISNYIQLNLYSNWRVWHLLSYETNLYYM